MRSACVVLLMAALIMAGALGAAQSVVGAPPSCRVRIDGREAIVHETAVNHNRTWTSRPQLSTSPVCVVTLDAPGEVEVEFIGVDVKTAVVRPLALGITPTVEGGVVRFALNEPANVVVEYNDRVEGALHLFANAPQADVPDASDPSVIYFGPGIHEAGAVNPASGQTVYLAEGCVLRGWIFAEHVEDVTVRGPGIISGQTYDRFADTVVPINFEHSRNIAISGVTILDPAAWTLNLFMDDNVTVRDVKIVSARSNSDGITIQSSKRVRVKDCFVRSWDDSLVVKGYDGDAVDIAFEDIVIWTDLAQSCEIGYETRADVIRDIVFRDITVLHNFHKPVLSIHNSDNALVKNVLFERVVVEDAQMGEGDGMPFLIDLTTTKSQWSRSKARGKIRAVAFRDIAVLAGKEPSVRIFSFNKEYNIDDVTIKGLTILGKRITGFDELKYNFSPRNGENIVFVDGE